MNTPNDAPRLPPSPVPTSERRVAPPDRPIGELFSELAKETAKLVRQEILLAKTEIVEKVAFAGRQLAFIAVGIFLAIVSVLALFFALILGLGTFIPLWASALVVGLVVAAVAIALGAKGALSLRDLDPKPRQTIRSLRETKLWVQEQVR